ncbi:MAG: hypothetical protein ACXAEL_04585 [Candidatus Hodarchaeales archaeon]|jgi:hypothetical protein
MKPLAEDSWSLRDFWKKELNFIFNETMAGLAKMKDLFLLLGYDKKIEEIHSLIDSLERIDASICDINSGVRPPIAVFNWEQLTYSYL